MLILGGIAKASQLKPVCYRENGQVTKHRVHCRKFYGLTGIVGWSKIIVDKRWVPAFGLFSNRLLGLFLNGFLNALSDPDQIKLCQRAFQGRNTDS